MTTLAGPHGPVDLLRTGTGSPVTLFVHGLGGSLTDTRPFGSGVTGSRWFLHLRGHGLSATPPGPWTYEGLAREVAAVSDAVGATGALGVSLGAGALLALAAAEPNRFARLVLVLPAVLDQPAVGRTPERAAQLADAVDAEDVPRLTELLTDELPEPRTPAMTAWVADRAQRLAGTAVSQGYRDLARAVPVPDPTLLHAIRADVLVLAAEDDPVHPVAVATAVADALPRATLEVLPPGGLLWAHRDRVRELVTAALAG